MCQYQELAVADGHYVVRCAACRHFQISFQSVVLSISQEEFDWWLRQLDCQRPAEEAERFSTSRSVIVGTPKRGVHLLLEPGELHLLKSLLDKADVEARTAELLQLFQS